MTQSLSKSLVFFFRGIPKVTKKVYFSKKSENASEPRLIFSTRIRCSEFDGFWCICALQRCSPVVKIAMFSELAPRLLRVVRSYSQGV